MRKRTGLLLLALALGMLLCGCGCEHDWKAQGCEKPMVCTHCGEENGEAPGHSWEEATCETVKTCSSCGVTEGEPLGHRWEEATCLTPEVCSACAKTQGEALGHKPIAAGCVAPSFCASCGEELGEPLGHNMTDWEPKNNAMSRWCKRCYIPESAPEDMDVVLRDNLLGTWKSCSATTFDNAGGSAHSVLTGYTITFREDGTLTYITDREYAGTWKVEEIWDEYIIRLILDTSEMDDLQHLSASVGGGWLQIFEGHSKWGRNSIFTRDSEEELETAKSQLVGQWENGTLRNEKGEQMPGEKNYSVLFREDGTVEMKLEQEMSGYWAYQVNQTGHGGHKQTDYRLTAFSPDSEDIYTINMYDDSLRIYVYQNGKHFVYTFKR